MSHVHDRAFIIASGDEIITGQLLDTNTRWIAQQLVDRGIMPVEFAAAPDDLASLVTTLRRACSKAPLVILSGGLGPTEGDLTRAALAEVMGEELILDPHAEQCIADLLGRRGRAMTDRQRRQAMRPRSADCLPNTTGTAPGLHARVKGGGIGAELAREIADVFCLPGPPGELRPMWEREVAPRLTPDPSIAVRTRLLHVIGMPEADCVDRLGDLTRRDRTPDQSLVGITASGGILTLRIRYEGPAAHADERIRQAERHARSILGDHIITPPGVDHPASGVEALASRVIHLLKAETPPRMLAVVESCTGGMLGEILTAIPGASAVFQGGYLTYSNAMKERLGVDPAALNRVGAVSAEVAEQMAARGLHHAGADVCLSITGIAGPDGGTPAKPVGTVHIGLAMKAPPVSAAASIQSRKFLFSGDREDIRRRSCMNALTMLYFALARPATPAPRLLWEV